MYAIRSYYDPASVSSVAIALAQKMLGDLSQQQILVVGAGEMARLAVKALRIRGLSNSYNFV